MAVIELWAVNRALTGAVFLIAVPGPGWGWGTLGVGRGQASPSASGRILFTAVRFFVGLLQPFVQLPLGLSGVISLKESTETGREIKNINHELDTFKMKSIILQQNRNKSHIKMFYF